MKLIIAGSRTIYATELEIQEYLTKFRLKPSEIVSGTARGMDKSGEKYAHSAGIAVSEFPADWDQFGKSAGYKRNEQMAMYADCLLIVWDGQSAGSKSMKKLMTDMGKKVYEIIRQPNEPDYVGRDNYFQFGKHKGKSVSEVPTDYLIWCLSNLDFKSKGFKKCVEEEIKQRAGKGPNDDEEDVFKFKDFGPEPSFDPSDDIPF